MPFNLPYAFSTVIRIGGYTYKAVEGHIQQGGQRVDAGQQVPQKDSDARTSSVAIGGRHCTRSLGEVDQSRSWVERQCRSWV